MSALQSQVIARVEQCIAHANQRLNKRLPMPAVSFRQRGKIAGSARLQGWEVRFNPVLVEENPQAFLDEVVPHEVAHLVTGAQGEGNYANLLRRLKAAQAA